MDGHSDEGGTQLARERSLQRGKQQLGGRRRSRRRRRGTPSPLPLPSSFAFSSALCGGVCN